MKRWKSCSGYVNIGIVGKYPEKTVNRLICEGFGLENIKRTGEGLTFRTRASDLFRARRILSGSGCRVRIIKKSPAARLSSVFRREKLFIVSLAVLSAVCAFLLTRVWFIRIEKAGIGDDSIAEVLDQQGVRVGCARSSVDNIALFDALMRIPGAVNARIVLKGVTLGIEISESAPGSGIVSSAPASGIYADKDCVISYISVVSGRALVGKGTAVRKGQLLISGDLSDLKEGFTVPAVGEIEGEVLHAVSATASNTGTSLVRTGNVKRAVSIVVLGHEFGFKPPFEKCELEAADKRLIRGCPVPAFAVTYDCFELEERSSPDTPEGTELRARLMAQEMLKEALPEDASVISVKTVIIGNADGSVTARITAVTKEKIGINR